MANADGSIVITVDADDKQAQKELNKLVNKIDSLNDKIYKKQQERMPLLEQSKQLGAELDAAKAKLDQMQRGDSFYTSGAVKEQSQYVNGLQKEWNSVNAKIEKADSYINANNASLDRAKEKAGELSAQISAAGTNTNAMSVATKRAEAYMDKFANRVKKLALRAFVFTMIAKALSVLRNYLWKTIQANDDAAAAIGQLKGALLTLVQPLLNVIIPAFTALVRILTNVVSAIANVVSMIFGTTTKKSAAAAKSMYEEANAIESVGSAAKSTVSSLASFDEINQLSTDKGGGGGAASALADRLSPVFDQFTSDAYKAKIDEITAYLSGALLALGAILCFSGANIPLGIGLMAVGAAMIATAVAINWNAMYDKTKETLTNMLVLIGTFALAIGVALCFSGANIPLGIALIIIGAASLATAVALNWDEMNSNVKQKLTDILLFAAKSLLALGIILAIFCPAAWPLAFGLMIAGGASLVSAAALNWDAILSKIKEVWGDITSWWNSTVANKLSLSHWKEVGKTIINGFLTGIKSAWETVKSWVANAVSWFRGKFIEAQNSIAASNSSRGGGVGSTRSGGFRAAMPSINTAAIPLATGAVIPPNKEFLAVLGDQKSGTNIETPLATMVEAFKQAMSESGGGATTVVIQLDGKEIARSTVKNINNMTRAAGKPVLLY